MEGGGIRGTYTAGVLDVFLEEGIAFPYVIGSSAGACNACSYLSGQK
ncbi:patatin-like phospholipase family protein, partial [Salmonella enterica]